MVGKIFKMSCKTYNSIRVKMNVIIAESTISSEKFPSSGAVSVSEQVNGDCVNEIQLIGLLTLRLYVSIYIPYHIVSTSVFPRQNVQHIDFSFGKALLEKAD